MFLCGNCIYNKDFHQNFYLFQPMYATLAKSLPKTILIVTGDAKFSDIFCQNKVFPQVWNCTYNNVSDFIVYKIPYLNTLF